MRVLLHGGNTKGGEVHDEHATGEGLGLMTSTPGTAKEGNWLQGKD